MSVKREQLIFIQCSAIISLISAIIVTISLATDFWIIGIAVPYNDIGDVKRSSVNYGLFKGFLTKRLVGTPLNYNLYLTCIWDRNVCIWSCQNNAGLRKAEVIKLINNQEILPCIPSNLLKSSSTIRVNTAKEDNMRQFLNSGMFITTIIFTVLTMVSFYCCSILAFVNCYKNPTISLLNMNGIMISSGVAFALNLIGLVVFGCNYHSWIQENVGIVDTVIGNYKSFASLGYSYWLFLFTCLVSPLPIVLLQARTMILMKSRAETTTVIAKMNDPTIALY